jgi:hypothetical protein
MENHCTICQFIHILSFMQMLGQQTNIHMQLQFEVET